MITLCVLNWNRPDNLREIILPLMAQYRLIDEIIISHGRRDTLFDFSSRHAHVVCLDDSDVNRDLGISRRWETWERARNPVVLSLDDDIVLPEPQLERLWERFQKDPNVMHGLSDGDRFVPSFMPASSGEQMLLSGCYMAPASLGAECRERAREYVKYMREPQRSYPLWDGDDIFASLTSYCISGRSGQGHDLTFRWLCLAYRGYGLDHNIFRHVRRQNLIMMIASDWGVPYERLSTNPQTAKVQRASRTYIKRSVTRRTMRSMRRLYKKPAFLILGSGRCGTTALFSYLSRHGRVIPPKRKELHVLNTRLFGSPYERLLYRRQFPLRLPWRCGMITGEATPNLLNSYGVSGQLADEYPKVRMIILLRNPIERTWSMYKFRCRAHCLPENRRESRTLEEALAQERQLLDEGVSPDISTYFYLYRFLPHMEERFPIWHAYLTSCLYARWIKKYFACFPREQFLILQSEALFSEPSTVLQRVHEFLDLDMNPKCDPGLFTREGASADLGAVPEGIREELREYFAQPNAELYDLLGENYNWQ